MMELLESEVWFHSAVLAWMGSHHFIYLSQTEKLELISWGRCSKVGGTGPGLRTTLFLMMIFIRPALQLRSHNHPAPLMPPDTGRISWGFVSHQGCRTHPEKRVETPNCPLATAVWVWAPNTAALLPPGHSTSKHPLTTEHNVLNPSLLYP